MSAVCFARYRELAWAQAGDCGRGLPAAYAAGRQIPGLVLDIDASVVVCHSEKERAAATFKHTFGYHPIFGFLDNTREALAGLLRPGNAGSNTAADHIAVLDASLAQIPDAHRHGSEILVRADTAGASHEFLAHIRAAITALPQTAWSPALHADGHVREGAFVAELTGLLSLSGWPDRMRVIVRRERPHPGAQLTLFDDRDGWRYTAFVTNTQVGSPQWLEVRHRAHARVEDRVRCAKDTGLGRPPSRQFAINTAWCTAAAIAADLIAWLQMLALTGELARAEPKTLRYRILHKLGVVSRAEAVASGPDTGRGVKPRIVG